MFCIPQVVMSPAIVAILGKGFIMFADALPPVSPTAGYFTKAIYNFIQNMASNSDKKVK